MLTASGAVSELMEEGVDLIDAQQIVSTWLEEMDEMSSYFHEWHGSAKGKEG